MLGGDPLANSTETDGVGFFSPEALPELSLGRVTPHQISRLVELAAEDGGATEFD